MKKFITVMLAGCLAVAAFAQPQGEHKGHGNKPDFEKIKAEKVAYITSEVGLTAQEAEAFWPIYNRIEEQQHALVRAERQAYMALSQAIKEGKDSKALLDDYLKAKEANVNQQVLHVKEYRKILPEDKVAKFFTCEEKFLRQQLCKLGGDKGGRRGGAPGRPPRGGKAPKELDNNASVE